MKVEGVVRDKVLFAALAHNTRVATTPSHVLER